MGTVYLTSDAGKLTRSNNTLVYVLPDGNKTVIFPHQTNQLVIQGNADLTSAAIKLLMKHGIQTVFLNKNGRFNGRVDFGPRKNISVRIAQHDRLEDEHFCLEWSRSIAKGKIRNQLGFAHRIGRKGEEPPKHVRMALRSLQDSLTKVDAAETTDTIRGLEGWAARQYYSIFRHNLIPDWATFKGRTMNPPKDNVNAVLSFLYTLLLYRVESAILSVHLDPYVGYFHTVGFGQEALAYDLMEQFRTPIAETVTANLFNLGILDQDDFRSETVDTVVDQDEDEEPVSLPIDMQTEESTAAFESVEAVLLTKDGIKKAIKQFERKLSSEVYVPMLGKRTSYRRVIAECVKQARRFILGEVQQLETFVLR